MNYNQIALDLAQKETDPQQKQRLMDMAASSLTISDAAFIHGILDCKNQKPNTVQEVETEQGSGDVSVSLPIKGH